MAKSEDKRPLAEAEHIAVNLQKDYFRYQCDAALICGSIRRRVATVADIDFVVLKPWRGFTNTFLFKDHEILVQGDRKISLIYHDIQVDIMIANDYDEYVPMILHCTGPKWSNIKLRRRAKDIGLKLNEYGLWRYDKRISYGKEEDIYKHLGLEYIVPENRG